MENDSLLELHGKWHEARRTQHEIARHAGDSAFHFMLPCSVATGAGRDGDQYVFQVWSKHGFTNFGRVHKLRARVVSHSTIDPFGHLIAEDSDTGRRNLLAPIAAITAGVTKRTMPVTYFAYGSNMAAEVMSEQCPHRCLGVARLSDHRLAFTRKSAKTRTGVVDIVPAPGETVWGILYRIDDYGLAAIDAKEGYGWAYKRVMLTVRLETNSSQHMAVAYTVIRKQPNEVLPSRGYLGGIIEAARERGLPPSYVERLAAVPTAEDI